jgi:hypothetical protein
MEGRRDKGNSRGQEERGMEREEGRWKRKEEKAYKSQVLANVTLRVMKIPDQRGVPVVPFTRVNHSKYMVTEKLTYITTSNWYGFKMPFRRFFQKVLLRKEQVFCRDLLTRG